MRIIEEKDFENEIKEGVVLVDFFATWCGPCRAMSTILDQLESSLQGKVKIIKVDTDNSENLASKFGIMSIPTLIIFKDGQMMDKIVGLTQKEELLDNINMYC